MNASYQLLYTYEVVESHKPQRLHGTFSAYPMDTVNKLSYVTFPTPEKDDYIWPRKQKYMQPTVPLTTVISAITATGFLANKHM
jgi:hypothetical protein